MEYETLIETSRKLPKFAKEFGVTVAELKAIINGWLPHVTVVKLPDALRCLDGARCPRSRPKRLAVAAWKLVGQVGG